MEIFFTSRYSNDSFLDQEIQLNILHIIYWPTTPRDNRTHKEQKWGLMEFQDIKIKSLINYSLQ